jgi:hypothetical protein
MARFIFRSDEGNPCLIPRRRTSELRISLLNDGQEILWPHALLCRHDAVLLANTMSLEHIPRSTSPQATFYGSNGLCSVGLSFSEKYWWMGAPNWTFRFNVNILIVTIHQNTKRSDAHIQDHLFHHFLGTLDVCSMNPIFMLSCTGG